MSGDHATLAPSSAFRRWLCPASRALEARLPEPDGPEAAEGTAAHHVAAHLLTTGELLEVGALCPNGHPVDQEMRDGAQMLADDIAARVDPGYLTHLKVEERVYAHQLIHPECDGTPDARVAELYRKRLRAWDYKYGHGYVEAHENPQGIEYLAGQIETDLGGWPEDDEEWTFEFSIVQPREYGREGPIRRWCGKLTDLRAHINFARDREHVSMQPDCPTIAGPTQCKNCKAVPTCQANQRYVGMLADYVGDNVPFDPPPSLVGQELTMLKRVEAMLKSRIAGMEAVAGSHIASGRNVPGWHFERGQSRLSWSKPPEVVIQAMQLIAGKDVSKPGCITPTQAIKLGIDQAVIAKYADRPPGELKLVARNPNEAAKVFK